ncbi:gem-associated protein 6 [Bombina bombina]|uniref:gem-associated protein 6 n=1 Tax=Bombina bombina TaxID=8345 RepID=UPI00235A4828|nr:gem-associated protein 6 [Bombina bombina]XP_053567904.1 gem-associated protein 6 [Bombina bombina]
MADWVNKTPLEWQTFINKQVKVLADERNEYQGWVITVDPVSASIVLVNFQEDLKTLVQVIMGHAVQQIEVLKEADDTTSDKLARVFGPRDDTDSYSKEDLETKKLNLKTWLEKNNIPVTAKDESERTLCVAGVLTIEPPYGPDNCCSTNEIILSRIQGLLQSYMISPQ